tara:strand:- start:417 stop:524 length:108 start_codon:yes stop_codon:yes gene_type:complete
MFIIKIIKGELQNSKEKNNEIGIKFIIFFIRFFFS